MLNFKTSATWWTTATDAVLDFLAPPECAMCHAPLRRPAAGEPGAFCAACVSALTQSDRQACTRCGGEVGPYLATDACPLCRNEQFQFSHVVRLGIYEGPLRTAIIRAKRSDQAHLARGLGELLASRRVHELTDFHADVLCPVPQHWRQRWFRGPNAATRIAEALAERIRVPLDLHLVSKTRATPRQTLLSATDRRKNLTRAFRGRRHRALSGARVLVVDDVLTTGTTANEVARALRQVGVAAVAIAAVARGLGRGPAG